MDPFSRFIKIFLSPNKSSFSFEFTSCFSPRRNTAAEQLYFLVLVLLFSMSALVSFFSVPIYSVPICSVPALLSNKSEFHGGSGNFSNLNGSFMFRPFNRTKEQRSPFPFRRTTPPPPPRAHPLETSTEISSTDHKELNQNDLVFDYKKGVKYLIDTAPNMNKLPPEFILPLSQNPLSASHADIPVIDLSGFSEPKGSERRTAAVKALSAACAQWGFFRIVNHDVKTCLIEDMLRVAEEFFCLSLEEKMKYWSEDVMRPVRYGTSLNTSKKHTLHWRDYLRHYGYPFQDSFHLWPVNPPNYRNVAKEYLEQIRELALRLGGAISEGLGLDPDHIENSLSRGSQILAANYYPRCPEPDKTLGLAAHSDHGGLAILMDNGVNGLQVKHNDTWIAVQHVPDSFVVNIGDYLEILSNGKYKSVEHRATVDGQKTRISVAVGHGPPLSSIIAPAPSLVREEEGVRYWPITYRDYVRQQQTTPTRGKSALDVIRTQT